MYAPQRQHQADYYPGEKRSGKIRRAPLIGSVLCELPRITLPKLFGKWPKASRAGSFGGEKRPIGSLRPLLAAFGTPILCLSRFSKQFLQLDFSHLAAWQKA